MKKSFALILTFFTFTILAACGGTGGAKNKIAPQGAATDTANYTTIRWVDSTQNFGEVKYGAKVNLVYRFENTGDKPLYVTNVHPTCGCTIADYTKNAVLPGEQGEIKAQFNSHHGAPGSIRKSIVISTNTSNDTHYVLSFTGMVIK